MSIPWKFFNLTPRDSSGVLLRHVMKWKSTTQISAEVTNSPFQVPIDNAFILDTYSAHGIGGAGQDPTFAWFQVLRQHSQPAESPLFEGGDQYRHGIGIPVTGVGEAWQIKSGLALVLPPGSSIVFFGDFSAGINANTFNVSISGWLIPRGDAAYDY